MTVRPGAAQSQDTTIATLETVDHTSVNWANVRSTAYLIHQHFRYEYTGPIRQLRQRLVIIPPERHGDQRLVTHRLEVSSPTTEINRSADSFGNLILSLSVDQVLDAIDFTAWIVIERDATAGPILVTPDAFETPAFREPSALTAPDEALRAAAVALRADGDDPAALAARINAWVYREMRYAHNVTGVRTTAAEAFALRQGVCQDYAHVMLVLCRLCGLPARYVSGHLLGEGGTHAWVEVLLRDPDRPHQFVARAFDPTHGNEPGLKYLTVAIGRDYLDVAPTSGTYVAPHTGQLSARKRADLTALSYFTPGDR
jgi:transglutaminase-like putative cysteine protease